MNGQTNPRNRDDKIPATWVNTEAFSVRLNLAGNCRRYRVLNSLVLILAFSSCLFAGAATGGLSGQVTDSRTKAVAGIVVAAIAQDGSVKFAVTDRKGRYAISRLPAGRYTIWAGGAGLPLYENTHLAVAGGRSKVLDIRLQRASPKPSEASFEVAASSLSVPRSSHAR